MNNLTIFIFEKASKKLATLFRKSNGIDKKTCYSLKIELKQFHFKKSILFPFFHKQSNDRKFQLILAAFLSNERLLQFFVENPSQKKEFISAIKKAAKQAFAESFYQKNYSLESQELLDQLTILEGDTISLLENRKKLKKELGKIDESEKEYLIFLLLNELKKKLPQLTIDTTKSFKKEFGKGWIDGSYENISFLYQKQEDHAKPLLYFYNHFVADQHLLYEICQQEDTPLLSACGNLESTKKVLEQILFLLNAATASISLKDSQELIPQKMICFISLYNWYELDLILAERSGIDQLQGKTLEYKTSSGEQKTIKLKLFYYNIPLSGILEPSHTKAALKDLKDEVLLEFCEIFFKKEPCSYPKILSLFQDLPILSSSYLHPYLEKQKKILEKIDRFRSAFPELERELSTHSSPVAKILLSLIYRNKYGKSSEIEELLILYQFLSDCQIHVNINSNQLIKILASEACIETELSLKKSFGFPRGSFDSGYQKLFSSLYTQYILADSTQLHAALSSGDFEENYLLQEHKKNRHLNQYFDENRLVIEKRKKCKFKNTNN